MHAEARSTCTSGDVNAFCISSARGIRVSCCQSNSRDQSQSPTSITRGVIPSCASQHRLWPHLISQTKVVGHSCWPALLLDDLTTLCTTTITTVLPCALPQIHADLIASPICNQFRNCSMFHSPTPILHLHIAKSKALEIRQHYPRLERLCNLLHLNPR
jgi:hypothetical protein